MVNWLHTVNDALDNAQSPVQFFFRDDDAGWESDKLLTILDEFAQHGMPIDLAVIPAHLDNTLANELYSRWRDNNQLVGLHQHGFSHTNHEQDGRKCEFGSSRTKQQQKTDIAEGQSRLQACFGDALDPFFTPPWNRCTQDTIDSLQELNFTLLSQDITAEPLESPKLKQVPVHIDWSKTIKPPGNPLTELGQAIAQNLTINKLTGIMLHHADMGSEQLKPLTELLALLSSHHNARCVVLRDAFN